MKTFKLPYLKSQLNESLKPTVIWANKSYSLEYSQGCNEYCLVTIKTGFCNWIIRYMDGKIAYDRLVADYLHFIVSTKIFRFHELKSTLL